MGRWEELVPCLLQLLVAALEFLGSGHVLQSLPCLVFAFFSVCVIYWGCCAGSSLMLMGFLWLRSKGYILVVVWGFSVWRLLSSVLAPALGCVGFSSCGSWALNCTCSTCGSWALERTRSSCGSCPWLL